MSCHWPCQSTESLIFFVHAGTKPSFLTKSTVWVVPSFKLLPPKRLTHPKRRLWKAEQTFQCAFSKHFSRVWDCQWAPDLGYETLKSASNTERFGLPKSSFGSIKFFNQNGHQKSGIPCSVWCDVLVFLGCYYLLPLPNEDFGRTFQKALWVHDLGYTTLKVASKTHSEMFVRPSKIFVWGAYFCTVPEIPESRLNVYACKRRFLSVWASYNRGFRGLLL